WGELNALELGGLAGELAIVGRWSEDLEVVVTPAVSGSFQLDLAWPGATPGTALRAMMSFIGTAGEPIAVALVSGNPEARALSSSGAIVTIATASEVAAAPLAVVAARQDLHLDETGRLVSVLFNRPIAPEPGLAAHFGGTIAFDGDGVQWEDPRPISTATPQPGDRIVNLGFDHILSTNASYTIAIDPLGDPLSGAAAAVAGPIVPRIDNDSPAGIIYGRVLRADNTPVAGAEVSLSIYSQKSKPFPASTQVVEARGDGSFLFESVRRDPELGFDGTYSLHAVDADGKSTSQSGAVRQPGRVQFVSLVYLGRGSAEGVVRYEDGTKVAGVVVVAGSTMFNQFRRTETDGNGFYQIADLPVGPLTLSVVDAQGNTVYAAVELNLPGQIVTKDLTIVRRSNPGLGSVSGVVRRSDTLEPVAAARVGVFSDGYAVGETYTGSDGRFAFERVPAGFVTVLAADWSVSAVAAAADFDLAADANRELTLTLEVVPETELETLEGNVLREDPLNPGSPSHYQPVADALVRIEGVGTVTADANGQFIFATVPKSFSGRPIDAWDPLTSRTGRAPVPTLPTATPMSLLIPCAFPARGASALAFGATSI
ncbi:MAG: hypothetical protein LC732_07400, partial [Acidobacteria bacterium]|nr:hypothetical protein [Acidobacteriota bacterium]